MEDPDHFSRRPAYRRMGMYLPVLIVSGLAMLMLIYLLTMQTLGWAVPYQIGPGLPAAIRTEGERSAVLYVSPTTQVYFRGVGGNYDRLLAPWRKHLAAHNWRFQEATTPEELDRLEGGILILPSAVALGEKERSAIESFKARGGSLLLTWASGTRGDNQQWSGWEWMERVGAAKVNGEITGTKDAPGFLVLDGETPATRSQLAGLRIWLGANHDSLLRLSATGDAQLAGRFMDWARTPSDDGKASGAIVYGEDTGAGRSIALGFSESAWEYQPQRISGLIEDALSFLARRPDAILAAWPEGRRAAQIIEMDAEQDFPNTLHLASLMDGIGYRGTFYVLTSLAGQFPDVVKALARTHEVAYHGDVHVSFKDQSEPEQRTRIQTMHEQLSAALPITDTTLGFRAPTEGYDQTTERLLAEAGYSHHLADPHRDDARLPTFVVNTGTSKQLVVLPRTQRDDINLLSEGTVDASQLKQRMAEELNLVEEQGALGVLSVHSQNFGPSSPLAKAMAGHLHTLASHQETLWLASSDQAAAWWRARDRVRVVTNNVGVRTEVNVSVSPGEPLDGISLVLMLPRKSALPSFRGAKTGMPESETRLIDPYRASIRFKRLSPGDYNYQVTF